jgi:hypothetical protein
VAQELTSNHITDERPLSLSNLLAERVSGAGLICEHVLSRNRIIDADHARALAYVGTRISLDHAAAETSYSCELDLGYAMEEISKPENRP